MYPFPIWNQSIVSCLVLTVAYWPTYIFLRMQVRWSGMLISFRIFHTVGSDPHSQRLKHSQWSRSRCFFLEFSCFLDDSTDVGNLISGSSAFLIPACASSSLAFHMIYYACKLNKQGDNIQPKPDLLLSQFGPSCLFHVWVELLLLDPHTDFSGCR